MRLDFNKRFSNPPAPVLQATGLFKERIARNEMEGGSTERNVKLETRGSPHGLHTVDS